MIPADRSTQLIGTYIVKRFQLTDWSQWPGMPDPDVFPGVRNGKLIDSWDTWEEARDAFRREGRIHIYHTLDDAETGRRWLPGAPYEWEAAKLGIVS